MYHVEEGKQEVSFLDGNKEVVMVFQEYGE